MFSKTWDNHNISAILPKYMYSQCIKGWCQYGILASYLVLDRTSATSLSLPWPIFNHPALESLHCGNNPLILLTIICFVFTVATIPNKQNLISRIAVERKGESQLILFIDLLQNLILNRISSETEIQLLSIFSFSKSLSPLKWILVSLKL